MQSLRELSACRLIPAVLAAYLEPTMIPTTPCLRRAELEGHTTHISDAGGGRRRGALAEVATQGGEAASKDVCSGSRADA